MMRNFLILFSLVFVEISSSGTHAGDGAEIYNRITPLEATTGVVSVGQIVGVRVDVPGRCEDRTWDCGTSQRFSSIYRIGFEVEDRFMTPDAPFVDREPRGTIYLALSVEESSEAEDYDDTLRESLASLGAATFDAAFAGLLPTKPPFGSVISAMSDEPSWVCFEPAIGRPSVTRLYRSSRTVEGTDKPLRGTHAITHGTKELVEPLCDSLARSSEAAYPDEIRTMSTARLLVERSLTVDVADMLPDEVYGDRLLPLPAGTALGRRKREGVVRSTSVANNDGLINARRTSDEVEIQATMTRAALPAAAARDNAWHARWNYLAVERRMGPRPERRDTDMWSVTASMMPTVRPRDLDARETELSPDPQRSYPIVFDGDAWFDAVIDALDAAAEITPEVLADALVERVAGLGGGGFVLAICMPDGSASWGLPPTTGRPPITNAREFCTSVEAVLP